LNSRGNIPAKVLVAFVDLQGKLERLLRHLGTTFGPTEILESFQTNFRFKLPSTAPLSAIFGEMEKQVFFASNF